MARLPTFEEDLRRVDLAIRDWARLDNEVRGRLQRVDEARLNYLRSQFRLLVDDPYEVEARCLLAFTFAIGRDFLSGSLDPKNSADVIRSVARLLGVTS